MRSGLRQFHALTLCATLLAGGSVEAGQCHLWLRYGGEELAHHTACNPGETITVKLASMSLTYQAGERSAVATLAPENLIFFNGENRQDLPVDSRTATPFYDKWAPGFVSGGHNKPIGVVGFQFLRE